MTPDKKRLDEIAARAEAATPGPWKVEGGAILWHEDQRSSFDDCGAGIATEDNKDIVIGGLQDEQGGAVGILKNEDARFIAHARQDIPDLLAHIDALQQERDAAREPIKEAYACQKCGRRDGLDAVLSNEIWQSIKGDNNILCLWCIDKRCAERGINTSVTLHFEGLAVCGTSQSAADRDHIARLADHIAALEQENTNLRHLAALHEADANAAREEVQRLTDQLEAKTTAYETLADEWEAAREEAKKLKRALKQIATQQMHGYQAMRIAKQSLGMKLNPKASKYHPDAPELIAATSPETEES